MASLTRPQSPDVKFWLFTRRTIVESETGRTVRVCEPRAVYGYSEILKRTDYFESVLCNGFAEAAAHATLSTPFPPAEKPFEDDYDYENDSDLEDDMEDDTSAAEQFSRAAAESDVRSHRKLQARHDSNILSGYTSPCYEILVKDMAFTTFRALIFYLYTGKVHFRGLKSNPGHTGTEELPKDTELDTFLRCSPKSMYRLAEKLGLKTLQAASLDAIKLLLTPSNILTEIFSEFTSLYPEVFEIENKYLCTHYDHPEVASGWQTALEKLCCGDYPHAASVMACLLKETLAPRRFTVTRQEQRPPSPDYLTLLCQLTMTNLPQATSRALLTSLTAPQQARIDTIFWVFSRKTQVLNEKWQVITRVDKPRAIYGMSSVLVETEYFRSLLASGFSESIPDATSKSALPKAEPFFDEYDWDSDSDLDEDEMYGLIDETSDVVELMRVEEDSVEGETSSWLKCPEAEHASCRQIVIKDAAFLTWYCLIYYIYTGTVSFLPLKSSDKAARMASTRKLLDSIDTRQTVPECSPKSMYRLACKLGLQDLERLSLKAIAAKLSTSNILTELLSLYTSLYPAVMEEEMQFLCAHFSDQVVMDSWETAVEKVCRGECLHAQDVIMILLRQKLQPKQEVLPLVGGFPMQMPGMPGPLTGVPYAQILSSGFNKSSPHTTYTSVFSKADVFFDEYDWESDSDLDEDEDDLKSSGICEQASDKKSTKLAEPVHINAGQSIVFESTTSVQENHSSACRQILIKDAAFITWQSLIYYLYTGKIRFLDFKSTNKSARMAETRKLLDVLNSNKDTLACSPKSMYHIACKLGLKDLQSLTLKAIVTNLMQSNQHCDGVVVAVYISFYAAILLLWKRSFNTYAVISARRQLLYLEVNTQPSFEVPLELTAGMPNCQDGPAPDSAHSDIVVPTPIADVVAPTSVSLHLFPIFETHSMGSAQSSVSVKRHTTSKISANDTKACKRAKMSLPSTPSLAPPVNMQGQGRSAMSERNHRNAWKDGVFKVSVVDFAEWRNGIIQIDSGSAEFKPNNSVEIATYLMHMGALGGGSRSLPSLAEERYRCTYGELTKQEKAIIDDRYVALFQWRNEQRHSRVYSTTCLKHIKCEYEGDAQPCSKCLRLLKNTNFICALNRDIADEDKMNPAAYRELSKYLPARSERSFQMLESKATAFPMIIRDEMLDLVKARLNELNYTGPVMLACDDTKLVSAWHLWWCASEAAYYLIGVVSGPLRVSDSEALQKTVDDAHAVQATKAHVYTLQVLLPSLAPIIIAALSISDSMSGAALYNLIQLELCLQAACQLAALNVDASWPAFSELSLATFLAQNK
ncbi:hypothetical protein NM688_g4650 [Phlebia brevispora]|uniref:Uncharacterized protein n=1 Tax=Phlebia brevispora TaxID=194682 RepID=A0ACC1T2C5_9APHY|nr:hypothetical protein NM688_g4650 [Phlebia brevispora]